MATRFANETSKCGLCHEILCWPRKFPNCGHYYCETCILIHLLKLIDDGDMDIGVACPACKVVNPGPKDIKAAIGWIKSLERVPDNKDKVGESKSSGKDMCSPCNGMGNTTVAEKFCFDCAEALCRACSYSRHSVPILRDHKLIDVGMNDVRPEGTSRLFQTLCELLSCDEHNGSFLTFYCNDHNAYGCETCVDKKHRYCADVIKANARTNEEETNDQTASTESLVEGLCTYANKMIQTIETYVKTNKTAVKNIGERLTATRKHVNALMQVLEVNGKREAEAISNERNSEHLRNIETLKVIMNSSRQNQELKNNMELLGSRSQYGVISQKIRKQMKANEYTTLTMSNALKKNKIELKCNDLLGSLLNITNLTVDRLFSIGEIVSTSSIPIYQSKLLLAQFKETKDDGISTVGKYNKYSPNYMSVMILKNNTLILVSEDDCIMIKPTIKVLKSINMSTDVLNLENDPDLHRLLLQTAIKDNVFAIPRPSEKRILILSAGEKVEIKGELKFRYQPKALHVLENGNIALALQNPVAFGIFSLEQTPAKTETYFCKDKTGRTLQSFEFMAVDEQRSHVIQPCTSDKAVYCFDFEGNPKFRLTDINPDGVGLDDDGNIYVCCSTWAIYILLPSGTFFRLISVGSDPLAIGFNKSGDQFAVTQKRSHKVDLFKLVKSDQNSASGAK